MPTTTWPCKETQGKMAVLSNLPLGIDHSTSFPGSVIQGHKP